MKKLLGILVLGLFLITPSQADDINDFQIEGMSVGDSLLDYFSESEIQGSIFRDYPGSDKYKRFYSWKNKSFEMYEGVQVNFMKGDKKYIIEGIAGEIKYPKNIDDCYQLMSEIGNQTSAMFPDIKKISEKDVVKRIDPTGESRQSSVYWLFPSGDAIAIACSDYSKEFENKNKQKDDLSVVIMTKELDNFLTYEAYK